MNEAFYGLSAKNLQGREISMGEYEGEVVLVVNTASKCGFTPQYEGLERLYRRYRERGFVILGFPCDQFGGQEPGDERSIAEGCLLNYGVSFPMFAKIEVNGRNTHPIFQFLKQTLPGFGVGRIKWNFTKFLLDMEGRPVRRFAPITRPERIEPYIRAAMSMNEKMGGGIARGNDRPHSHGS